MTAVTRQRRLGRWAALLAALSALGLSLSLLAGAALAVTSYASVSGYQPFSSDANHADFWERAYPGKDCFDADASDQDTYVLPALGAGKAYFAVIVKAGATNVDPYTNTIFAAPPSAGQTVWADTNGNGTFDDGDKQISHIIVCVGKADESASQSQSASESASESASASASQSQSASESASESASASASQSQSASESASPTPTPTEVSTPTPEESIQGSTSTPSPTPEQSVEGGTGTPAPSLPDGAMVVGSGPSPLPAVIFGLLLLASLTTLAWVNVKAVRSRA